MSLKLQYSPAQQDNSEFHRIREWHNTFNAFVQGALSEGFYVIPLTRSERRELRREARRFADSVHGSIRKPESSVRNGRLYRLP